MMAVTARQRLAALTLVGLFVLGGAVAAVALRPEPAGTAAPGAAMAPSAVEAVRRATSLSAAFVAIADAVMPAVVRIEVEQSAARELTGATGVQDDGSGRGRPGGPGPEYGGGSGFLVSTDGYILTNHHVVAGAERITVVLRDKRTLPATVVGTDPLTDVAVIRVAASGLPSVALGNSDDARVGEWVLAIGNPGFANASTLDFTVTSGIVSAKGRPLNILGTEVTGQEPSAPSYVIEDFIQTDAVINPGNSGGPLVNLQGAVIGINTAIASTTGYSQGYGFAIPSNLAQRVMRDLMAHGYVRRPLLGISIADVTPEDAEVYRLQRIAGVVVEDFAPESPARRSGLQQHDVIVAVDDTPVERVGQLQRLIAQHEPGETVRLTLVRYGGSLEVRVRLVEADGSPPPKPAAGRATLPAGVGLELEELTPERAQQLGFSRAGGALVAGVVPGSAADRKNIGVGHRMVSIDGRAIGSVAAARAALRGARSGQILSMVLEFPGGRTYIANVRVP
jgi:serine protease Do